MVQLVGWLELGMRARRTGREALGTWGSAGVVPCALSSLACPEKDQRFGGVYGSPVGE